MWEARTASFIASTGIIPVWQFDITWCLGTDTQTDHQHTLTSALRTSYLITVPPATPAHKKTVQQQLTPPSFCIIPEAKQNPIWHSLTDYIQRVNQVDSPPCSYGNLPEYVYPNCSLILFPCSWCDALTYPHMRHERMNFPVFLSCS